MGSEDDRFLDEDIEMDDEAETTGAVVTVPTAVRRLAARRSLEVLREKKALRMQLQDTFDDAVDLEELGW
jgi:hypothetical protein